MVFSGYPETIAASNSGCTGLVPHLDPSYLRAQSPGGPIAAAAGPPGGLRRALRIQAEQAAKRR